MSEALFAQVVRSRQDRKLLAGVGVRDLESLLRRFPRRWVDPGALTAVQALREAEPGTDVIVHATVESVATRKMQTRRGSITTVELSGEGGGIVEAVFFNQNWLTGKLRKEMRILVSGKLKHFNGRPQLSSPTLLTADGQVAADPAQSEESAEGDEALTPQRPIPVYPATGKLSSQKMRGYASAALDLAPPDLFSDPIPGDLREKHGLMEVSAAVHAMHRPTSMKHAYAAQKRWAYEEALALQTHLLQRREEHAAVGASALEGERRSSLAAFDARLPFSLTDSQAKVGELLSSELAGDRPMNRLLQGDVGSGKTLVAVRAMLQAVDSGAQAVMLAPTEVLASQHHRSLLSMLGDQAVAVRSQPTLFATDMPRAENTKQGGAEQSSAGTEVAVALLTGSMPKKERQALLTSLVMGDIDIVVGTHALLSDTTMFTSLGMVVVDEQHRFGVEQRAALRQKAKDTTPHTLVMTATPIPRSAALTVFGDLDFSTLTEMPTGPKRIRTHVVNTLQRPTWLDRVYQVMGEHVAHGHQVFVVLPRVETVTDEEGGEQQGVDDFAADLRQRPELAGARVGVLHGQLPAAEKDERMGAFASGEIDVLVATTVIEVGIDVPNARVMTIMDADRFGIAQLHQLRGRVGRSGDESLCFLITEAAPDSEAMDRLATVESTLDGFALADFDIRTRREGDVLGRQQWGGRSSLQHLSVLRHETLIRQAREDAQTLLARDPALSSVPALGSLIRTLFQDTDEEIFEAG